MKLAKSIFLNEKITSEDNRLNYHSYERVGLICEECGELVFFKQGIEKISHFSHFRKTGQKCSLRTQSHNNKQDSNNSWDKEQSLSKFQMKFKKNIEEAIIQYQKISYFQLLNQIIEGKTLVDEYNINIDKCLSLFDGKTSRDNLRNIATSLYQNNKSLSDVNREICLNLLDYLCVPASKDILINILYYVFFNLNKKKYVNINFEEVRSNVIEMISYVDCQKEYKQVTEESLKVFQRTNEHLVRFYKIKNEPLGKNKMLMFAKALGHIGTELDNENESLMEQHEADVNLSENKSFKSFTPLIGRSKQEIYFCYHPGKCKNNKNEKVYSKIEGQSDRVLTICWQKEISEQHLIFEHNGVKVATFSLLNNQSIQWKPLWPFYMVLEQVAIPSELGYDPIVSDSLEQFFLEWLMSAAFARNLSLRTRTLEYFPGLVKLLLLYLSYAAESVEKSTKTALLIVNRELSLEDEVAKTFKVLISGLPGDTPHMKRIYKVDETVVI